MRYDKDVMRQDPCEYCEGKLEHCRTQAPFHYRGGLVFVDHVPAWVCVQCGEHYYDAPVYKQLENIAKHRSKIRKIISFPLADFAKIAV